MVPMPSPGALAAPSPRPPVPIPKPTDAGAGRYAFAALTNAAVRIRQACEGHRHDTLLREARALARLVVAGLLTEGDLSGVLRGAGVDAGKPEEEIDKIVAWAMDHASPMALLEGMSP
jgi:hypothetical protein